MEDYSSWILRNPNIRGIEIIFDKTEIGIQRDLKRYWYNILFYTILCCSFFSNMSIYYDKNKNIYYLFLIFIIALIIIVGFEIYKLIKARKINERVYSYSEIKCVQTEKKLNKIKITIEFNDGKKDNISIIKSPYYKIFIDILKNNNVEIIENNKR